MTTRSGTEVPLALISCCSSKSAEHSPLLRTSLWTEAKRAVIVPPRLLQFSLLHPEKMSKLRTFPVFLSLASALLFGGCAAQPKPELPYTNQELIVLFTQENLDARETSRGVVVTLPTLLFAFGSADLTPEMRSRLDKIATILGHKRAEGRSIEIEGHSDAVGTNAANLELSQKRSDTTAQELIAGGIRRDRLTTQGFGEEHPVALNTHPDGSDNPEGRAQNRRVEVIVKN